MSRFTLTSLFALVLSVVPACDGEDYAALGLSAEELDRMSAEELDALAESEAPDDLLNPLPPPTHGSTAPLAGDDLGKLPRFTHGGDEPTDDLGTRPRFTHGEHNPDLPSPLPGFTNGPHPTHDGDLDDLRVIPEEPEGCDTHGDEPSLTAR